MDRPEPVSARPWDGWAGDPWEPWAPARFELTDRSLVIHRRDHLGEVTVEVPLAEVAALHAVPVAGSTVPGLVLSTSSGDVVHLCWPPDRTDDLLAGLHRAHRTDGPDPPAMPAMPAPQRPEPRDRLAALHDTAWARRVAAVAAVLLLLAGMALVDAGLVYGRVQRTRMVLPNAPDRAETWLLLGSDSRDAARPLRAPDAFGSPGDVPGERADVILILQTRPGGVAPRLLSVPRDLLVFRRGHGIDRLALTLLDGPAATATSICRSLGVAVDHVAVVRFDGLAALVDGVGGVELTSGPASRDLHTGLKLAAGLNHLDGRTAVAWVRSRHVEQRLGGTWVEDVSGDNGRQARQRILLALLADALAQRARNPLVAQRLAWTAAGALQTDRGAGPLDLVRLGARLRSARDAGSLPHSVTPGPIPVARLAPAAAAPLEALRGGRGGGPPCPRPFLPGDPPR